MNRQDRRNQLILSLASAVDNEGYFIFTKEEINALAASKLVVEEANTKTLNIYEQTYVDEHGITRQYVGHGIWGRVSF